MQRVNLILGHLSHQDDQALKLRQHCVAAESKIEQLEILPPDDFHCHVRDGNVLRDVVGATADKFARAIIMPNLRPPVTTTEAALAYRQRILTALTDKQRASFTPLMTLYLTDRTQPSEIIKAKKSGHIYAVKLYPAGATTNSDSGVTDIIKLYPTLREMARQGLPLLVHGEVTDKSVDIFGREQAFLTQHMSPLVNACPDLKVVLEHCTTKAAVDYVLAAGPNLAATITAHHLLYNRNAIFNKGFDPHYYCLPVLKTEMDRLALVAAATSGNPKFFAGTDSAPHPKQNKERCCGSAGCYTAYAAVELYTETFDNENALDKLEGFLCTNGADFYGLPRNKGPKLTLKREAWSVPETYSLGDDKVVPLRAGESMPWSVAT